MSESSQTAPWEELQPLLRPSRPVDLLAHAAGAFVDGLLFVLIMIVLSVTVAMAESYVAPRPARLPGILAGAAAWMMLILYGASEILFAASPGKWMARLTTRAADAAPASRRRLALRCAIKCSPLLAIGTAEAMLCISRLPIWETSSAFSGILDDSARRAAALSQWLAWGVALGTLLALLPSRRTLHDWIAGTAVFFNRELAAATRVVERGFEVQLGAPGVAPMNDSSSDNGE